MQIQSIDSLTHEQAKEQLRLERAANLELRQQLEAIGAGGVSSERMMQPASVPSDAEALKQLLSIIDVADAMGWDTTKARALLAKYGSSQGDAECSRWISVKERMPEIREWSKGSIAGVSAPVLTVDKRDHESLSLQRLYKGGQGDLTTCHWGNGDNPTHWMPVKISAIDAAREVE